MSPLTSNKHSVQAYRRKFMATMGSAQAYGDKVLGIETANLIAYWPMWETSGGVADNYEGTAARDGAYTGVTLGQNQSPFTCPLFDGANDYNDVYTVSFRDAFNGATGTVALWLKVSGSGVWTDSSRRYGFRILADADNYVQFSKDNSPDDTIEWVYRAGALSELFPKNGMTTTDWFHIALTWDKPGTNKAIAYYNGAVEGSEHTIDGVWAGTPIAANTIIGAGANTPSNVWDGWLAHAAVWTTALSAGDILSLATV